MLSGEKTPTLTYIIPAFTAFILCWENLMEEHPGWSEIIQPGLDKLEDYENRLTNTHIVALGKFIFYSYINILFYFIL
jgi:hypothetical protein